MITLGERREVTPGNFLLSVFPARDAGHTSEVSGDTKIGSDKISAVGEPGTSHGDRDSVVL